MCYLDAWEALLPTRLIVYKHHILYIIKSFRNTKKKILTHILIFTKLTGLRRFLTGRYSVKLSVLQANITAAAYARSCQNICHPYSPHVTRIKLNNKFITCLTITLPYHLFSVYTILTLLGSSCGMKLIFSIEIEIKMQLILDSKENHFANRFINEIHFSLKMEIET